MPGIEAIEMFALPPILVGELKGDGFGFFLLHLQALQVKGAAVTEHRVDAKQRQYGNATENGGFVFPRYWG